jgi:heme exporter protein A
MAAASAILQARALQSQRAGFSLFEPVDFALHAGALLWLEGDNGVGKTSLIRGLLGLGALGFEELYFRAEALPQAQAKLRQHSRWLQHAAGLKHKLSLRHNWQYWAAIYGASALDVEATADRFALSGLEDQRVEQLSAGQKKRAQLAILEFGAPLLWLLDEPFANLDKTGIALVERMLLAHLAQGGAALVTSHGVLGNRSALAACAQHLTLRPARLERALD